MPEQETLLDESKAVPRFDPLVHGLWAKVVDGGRINHGAWLRACAAGDFVGTCRRCGDYLVPLHPYEVRPNRVDYEAHCVRTVEATMVGGVRQVQGCGQTICAPGGRAYERSARQSERGEKTF